MPEIVSREPEANIEVFREMQKIRGAADPAE
jgi:hypothetical protein